MFDNDDTNYFQTIEYTTYIAEMKAVNAPVNYTREAVKHIISTCSYIYQGTSTRRQRQDIFGLITPKVEASCDHTE